MALLERADWLRAEIQRTEAIIPGPCWPWVAGTPAGAGAALQDEELESAGVLVRASELVENELGGRGALLLGGSGLGRGAGGGAGAGLASHYGMECRYEGGGMRRKRTAGRVKPRSAAAVRGVASSLPAGSRSNDFVARCSRIESRRTTSKCLSCNGVRFKRPGVCAKGSC